MNAAMLTFNVERMNAIAIIMTLLFQRPLLMRLHILKRTFRHLTSFEYVSVKSASDSWTSSLLGG